jgi:hypothetical protein
MNNLLLSFSGADLERLRTLVTAVGAEVAHTQGKDPNLETQGSRVALDTTWTALVKMLDLGTAPEMRECPECGRHGMAEATRCGYCWSKLPALMKSKSAA